MAASNAAPTQGPSIVQRKLAKVLELDIADDKELITALSTLSTFYNNNSLSSRRNLRSEVEKKSIGLNKEFLLAFQLVFHQLEKVEEDVKDMKESCASMADRLNQTKQLSLKLIDNATKLNQDKEEIERKEEVMTRFISKFQLTPEESQALRGANPSTNVIDEHFFTALSRLHQIQNDCKLLLRSKHQKAGLEIMEYMGIQQQAAYDRLYRWVKATITELLQEEIVEVIPLLPIAFKSLHDRPVYFNYCISDIETIRSKVIVRTFIEALTKGGPNGSLPRPIEIHAHDPLRYLGDILAWIHQSVANEFELLYSILHLVYNKNITSSSQPSLASLTSSMSQASLVSSPAPHKNSAEDPQPISTPEVAGPTQGEIGQSLGKIYESISRPLKVRLEQVLSSSKHSFVLLFKLANLSDFYTRTISKHMHLNSPLLTILDDAKKNGMKLFFEALTETGQIMQRSPPQIPLDLSPPHVLHEQISRLIEIIATFDGSLVPAQEREVLLSPVLSGLLDPLLKTLTLSATQSKNESDVAVYMINSISTIQNAIIQYQFTSYWVEKLTEMIEMYTETLVEEETYGILLRCGLRAKLIQIEDNKGKVPVSSLPGMDSRSMAETLRSFESSLFEFGALSMPQCDRLLTPSLRNSTRNGVAYLIASAYSSLYNVIMDPKNRYDNPQTLLRYKPEQFALLCT